MKILEKIKLMNFEEDFLPLLCSANMPLVCKGCIYVACFKILYGLKGVATVSKFSLVS